MCLFLEPKIPNKFCSFKEKIASKLKDKQNVKYDPNFEIKKNC